MKAQKRCYFFEPTGEPVHGGCPRSAEKCRFVHPSDPEWAILPATPAIRKKPSFAPYRPRSPDRSSKRSRSPISRGRSYRDVSKSRSRSPKASRSGQAFSEKDLWSPSTSSIFKLPFSRTETIPSVYSAPPKRNPSLDLAITRPRADSNASSLASPLTPTTMPFPQRNPQVQTPTWSSLPPAPRSEPPAPSPPPLSAPPPPTLQQVRSLPALPKPPAFVVSKQTPPSSEPSVEDKRKTWADYLKLLGDHVQQRSKLAELDQEISFLKQFMDLSASAPVQDGGEQHARRKLESLEAQRGEEIKNLESMLSHITSADSWPVAPPTESNEKEIVQGVAKYTEELERRVAEVNLIITRTAPLLATEEIYQSDPTRPLKRRRLHDEGPDDRDQDSAQDDDNIQEDLRDRILALDSSLKTLENDFNVMQADAVAECNYYTDVKVEEAMATVTTKVEDVDGKLANLTAGVTSAEEDITELAAEIEKLILDNSSIGTHITQVNQAIIEVKTNLSALEEQRQATLEGQIRLTKQVEALEAAHAAHLSRPMSPPMSPRIPPIDYIIQSVKEPILDVARLAIQPMLTSLREDVQALIQERNAEVYQTLWSRLSLTLKVIDAISAQIPQTDPTGSKQGASTSTT